jgi:uncharacterized protein YjbI with pentapeptide repeats
MPPRNPNNEQVLRQRDIDEIFNSRSKRTYLRCTLHGHTISNCIFRNLKGSTMDHVDFSNSTIKDTDFIGCDLKNLDFSGTTFVNVRLINCQFNSDSFDNAIGEIVVKFNEKSLSTRTKRPRSTPIDPNASIGISGVIDSMNRKPMKD